MRLPLVVLVSIVWLGGCAHAPPVRFSPGDAPVPVLFVHGTDDTASSFLSMLQAFEDAGWSRERLYAMSLHPQSGEVPIEVMAYQVAFSAESLRKRTRSERIDVVAFSQGALSTRYWLQFLGGRGRVRRFISIAGPHHGTWLAWLRGNPALEEMRPNSAFLRELNQDPDYGDTEVFSFWTPWDGVVVPTSSTRLAGSHERRFLVPFHFAMPSDPSVIAATVDVLASPPAR
jgi:triacylglycerol lipase